MWGILVAVGHLATDAAETGEIASRQVLSVTPASHLTRRRPSSRAAASSSTDTLFPRAVRGEDYSRYASATWAQAVRWLHASSATITGEGADAYSAMRDLAAASVERALYPQEEQLVAELMQREWNGIL